MFSENVLPQVNNYRWHKVMNGIFLFDAEIKNIILISELSCYELYFVSSVRFDSRNTYIIVRVLKKSLHAGRVFRVFVTWKVIISLFRLLTYNIYAKKDSFRY